MQGITVALYPEGIQFFVKSLFASNGEIAKAINAAALADFTVTVSQDIFFTTGQNEAADCSNVEVQFSNGNISNFTPIFQSLQQDEGGVFQLVLSSDAFNANYSWLESYTRQNQTYEQSDNPDDPGQWVNDGNSYQVSTPFNYSAGIGSLATTANFTFTFDTSKNLWELPVTSITAVASNPSANIPSASVLQDQDQPGCVQSHVDGATEASIDKGTDFSKSLTTAFGGYLTSIPDSGQLYQDPQHGTITFAFGLGDSPLTFPNDIGLSVGVTGISTYTAPGKTPQQFPGTPPTNLPVPSTAPIFLFGGIPASEAANFDAKNIVAITTDFSTYSENTKQFPQYPLTNPTVTVITAGSEWLVVDGNKRYRVQLMNNQLQVFYTYHLQTYVSDYTLNGLYWAFAMAGKLNSGLITPTDPNLPDPSVLDVSTYFAGIPVFDPLHKILEPFRLKTMNAVVMLLLDSNKNPIPPTVQFQTVYAFNKNTLPNVQKNVPTDVYTDLTSTSIISNTYANTTDLESDLSAVPIASQYFQAIESAIEEQGAVVTHNLEFTCTIQGATLPNGDSPSFTFTLTRQDILTDLQLGISTSGTAQTLQFTHTECQPSPTATLTASNFIPSGDSSWFAALWPSVGEPAYSQLLVDLGKQGVPLPIMQGFQFLFEEALTNLEQGYIGILSNVEFTS